MTSKIKRKQTRHQQLKYAQDLREKLRKNNDKIRDLGYENALICTKILRLGFGIPQ